MARGYDLVVIGGGTAGIIAAKTAVTLGARVALVERARTGGDCLWTGCVPSKALIAAAAAAHHTRTGGPGVAPTEPKIDFAAVMVHARGAITTIEPEDSPEALAAAGVEVIHGDAAFTGPREIGVGVRGLRFRRAVVATGSAPVLPPVPGLAGAEPLTSDTVWELAELPERIVVLGGGPIGCELGQAFARLGSQVTIIEATDRLVPREEPAAGALLADRLAGEGVRVLVATAVTGVTGTPGAITVRAAGPDGPTTVVADRVLVAAGRRPTTEGVALDLAGVRTDERGRPVVDRRLRTSNPRVYAAGDVTDAPAFTHVAALHGSVAASNAILGPLRGVDNDRLPWVTFTDPEIARVGLTEAQARDRHGSGVRVRSLPHTLLDRAVTEAATDGFTRVVLDAGGRVLGATIVAPRAGEMITELGVVLTGGGRLRRLASVVHAYPSWSQAVWTTAVAEATGALAGPFARPAVALLRALRRVAG